MPDLEGVYNRKCYLEYYDIICKLLFRVCVTVTATSGKIT